MKQEENHKISRAEFLKLAGLFSLGIFGLLGCHRAPNDPDPDQNKDDSDTDQFGVKK